MVAVAVVCGWNVVLRGEETVRHPFLGVTHVTRTETSPRNIRINIVQIDLTVPGLAFKLTPPGGTLETVRQTTLAFLQQEQAQVAVNSHFFLPFPSSSPYASLIGLAASNGVVYSAFEAPVQSYALVTNAPAINIDPENRASVVHAHPDLGVGTVVREDVTLWNALAGSAQIVTDGVRTIPMYVDAQHPDGLLTPGSPSNYSNSNSWYNLFNARTAIGLSGRNKTLVLFTVDRAGGSLGMSLGEVADMLIRDYGVDNALSLDGGGSTTLAMENPVSHARSIVNVSSDNPSGRAVASNLAVFAETDRIAPWTKARSALDVKGWSNADVLVTLEAVDNHGGWVRETHTALTGAQSAEPHMTPGASASTWIVTEGLTTLTYFAVDEAGNAEAPQTLTVGIDRTAPVIAGMPAPGCTVARDGAMGIVATLSALDALSATDTGAMVVSVSSSHPGWRSDRDSALRYERGRLYVSVRAAQDTPAPATYTITATARDRAGNVTTDTAVCGVR